MARDFRRELAGDRFWDRRTQRIFEACGEPRDDCALQCREEVIALCEWIEATGVRSFLEVGIWTGRLTRILHRLFAFDRVAACDQGYAETLGLPLAVPSEARFLRADSESEAYRAFREALGPIDLVLIDANHAYHAVRRDFEVERAFPQRFVAFHDIAGASRHTVGVAKLWREIDHGHRAEIRRPNAALRESRPSMGIGLWSASEDPARGPAQSVPFG
ncbi:MAG: class I SAM-dependent methyltransferase [Polyangiaceae bacterium]